MLSDRAKRVLVYTASLLTAPMPVMPFAKGTREFALSLVVCAVILILSSFYVVRGEIRLKHRSLLGNKLLATSLITLIFATLLFLGALISLVKP